MLFYDATKMNVRVKTFSALELFCQKIKLFKFCHKLKKMVHDRNHSHAFISIWKI